MWDGFPLAGPGSVFFADFGGGRATAGNCLFAVCRTE